MKARYFVAAAAAAFAFGSVADAAIYVSVKIDGVLATGSTPNVALDAGTGSVGILTPLNYSNATIIPLSAGSVMVNLQAQGKGSGPFALTDPSFATQALSIDYSNLTTAHTVQVLLSQTDLVSPITSFALTETLNGLGGATGSTGSAAAYIGATNTAYLESTQIGTLLTCATPSSCSYGATGAASHEGKYSETVEYNFTLTGSGNVSANTRIAAAVPEPASWGLMVLGFGVIGGALRTSRRKVVFA